MSDLETLLRDTLVSHGREAPPGHGLLASIRARESRRRHRTRLAAGSATVAVTATIITAAGLLDSKAPNRPTAAGLTSAPVTPGAARVSLATSPPTPRAGSTPTRPVSFRGVQVEVPRAWKLNDLRCGTPVHSTAIIGAGPYQPYCSAIERQGLTVVRIEAVASTFGQLRATVATHAMTVDGQPALRGTGAVPGLKTRVTALVLSRQGVVISVESPRPGSRPPHPRHRPDTHRKRRRPAAQRRSGLRLSLRTHRARLHHLQPPRQ